MSERVRLQNITKRFDDTVAVNDVSLTVESGETLGIVGPSGCGKTTTLRTVAGFETPSDGDVLFGEESVTNVPPEQRNVGLVFQSYALFDNMTVRQNVEFGLKMRDVPADERQERAQRLLEMLDIGGMGDRDPTTLSGGQQQRVGLARALAIEPRVLLLDEPMTGLDAQLKNRLQREIGSLLDELEVTALYVTHDQEEAMVMCDRIAVMNEGILEQVGPPEEVYAQPANAFVADFIGTSNLLSGRISDGRLDLGFAAIDAETGAASFQGEVTATIRPGAFEVSESGAFEATIEESFYLGEHVQVLATLPNGESLTLHLDPRLEYTPGDTITLAVDPADVHFIDRS
ncbi:ABC transporter ATP-binding protein [Halobellus ruber]|uniref:Molybdate/tungstate import ATP-binding protein WtpC n=1 Tax=Halobellus ruber TaxID=2761102 RepID=A0A7J9SFE3_9EURY|nr:ABC transporter ATP-binding protein [Halobellus ruber]MBB6645650.1 ABC transporter ATP-binding protein [Halobellus ruber]